MQPIENNSCFNISETEFLNENPTKNHSIQIPFPLSTDVIAYLFSQLPIISLRGLQLTCKAFHYFSRKEYIARETLNKTEFIQVINRVIDYFKTDETITDQEDRNKAIELVNRELIIYENEKISFDCSGNVLYKFMDYQWTFKNWHNPTPHDNPELIDDFLAQIGYPTNKDAHFSEQFAIKSFRSFFDPNLCKEFLKEMILTQGYPETLNLILIYVKYKRLRQEFYCFVISNGLEQLKINENLTPAFLKDLKELPVIKALAFCEFLTLSRQTSKKINEIFIHPILKFYKTIDQEDENYQEFREVLIKIFLKCYSSFNSVRLEFESVEVKMEIYLSILSLLTYSEQVPSENLTAITSIFKSSDSGIPKLLIQELNMKKIWPCFKDFDPSTKVKANLSYIYQLLKIGVQEFVDELHYPLHADFPKEVLSTLEIYPNLFSVPGFNLDEAEEEIVYPCIFKLLTSRQVPNRNKIKRLMLEDVKNKKLKTDLVQTN